MSWSADADEAPQRDGLDVYNLRAYTAPFPGLEALAFEAEYVKEDNGDALDSSAWSVLAGYQFSSAWEPRLTYRYAIFEGDDPATAKNEAFDPLLTGFHDWGTWWQGEIAGEYFLSNSNLISHQLRLHVAPSDAIETGLILYDFRFDKPASLGPQVTSDDVGVRARLVHGLVGQRQHHAQFRGRHRGARGRHRAVVGSHGYVLLRHDFRRLQLLSVPRSGPPMGSP